MLQDPNCNVVQCGDPNCKLCTMRRPGETRGPDARAYVVYTCESPNCSLCRVETDVLLDLFCPFNSDQDINEITRNINNISGIKEEPLQSINVLVSNDNNDSVTQSTPQNQNSELLRELLLQGNPNRSLDLDLADDSQSLNDVSLMNLALEMQLDKIADLPELKEQGLMEFI